LTQSRARFYSPAAAPQYPQHHKNQNDPDQFPAFNFKELGANRTVKFVIIAGLTVIGTMETIFYAQILMRKMGWDSVKEDQEKE
jgi:hypothetical protein